MFARFHASLDRREPDGTCRRASLEASAAHGNTAALAALTPPPFPDLLGYLWEWALEIRRGLGFDMHGLAPLSWVTLDAWCRRTHTEPDADEVTALFALDAVMREKEPPKVVGAPVTNRIAAFPSKKEFV